MSEEIISNTVYPQVVIQAVSHQHSVLQQHRYLTLSLRDQTTHSAIVRGTCVTTVEWSRVMEQYARVRAIGTW